MATLASISSNSCEASPSFRHLPLGRSESFKSSVFSDGSSSKGIVSILLSAADLAKLDLSKLQLFSADGLAMESIVSSEILSSQTEVKTFPNGDVSFHTPLVLSPTADLSPGDIAFPVLKSKGVVEAEKASTEHRLLKLGAVSQLPRARKKAISMDEISLNANLRNFDVEVSGNIAALSNGRVGMVKARRQLPELELAALPPPGLEQRAETLKKKHIERVLTRTISEIRREEVKIDVQSFPAGKFLLQVMPWELTPPITPVRTPAAIPFIWEDAPGRPKPYALPSPCSSLPLPPRLLLAPPPSSSSVAVVAAAGTSACPSSDSAEFLPHLYGKQLSPAKSNPPHGRTHRKNMHSWHALNNLFSSSYQRCPSHAIDASLEAHTPAHKTKNFSVTGSKTSMDGGSFGSTSVTSNSTSSDLSSSTATASEDDLSSCESSLGARYELPPIYVAPLVPLTPPHRDLGPLEDECGKQPNRSSYLARLFCLEKCQRSNVSRTGSFFNPPYKHGKVASDSNCYLLDDAKRGQTRSGIAHSVHTVGCSSTTLPEVISGTRKESVTAQMSPVAASLYRSPKPSKPRIQIGSGRMKVFLKLRRRGARVIVASYRAVKQALLLRKASHAKHFDHTQLPYHALHG